MNREGRIFFVIVLGIFLTGLVSADCILNAKLINQDPYPAVPGENVKVVFQIDGVSNPLCKDVIVKLNEKYPFSLDPSQQEEYRISSGVYSEDYKSFFLAPFNLRVDSQALTGNQSLELLYSYVTDDKRNFVSQKFNISVEDLVANFEVHVDSYSFDSNKLSFVLLSIGNNDVRAVSVDVVDQEGVQVIGSKRVIIGDLDANQDDVANFDVILDNINNIKLMISYTDLAGNRRVLYKDVVFDPKPFRIEQENGQKGKTSPVTTFWIGLFIPIIVFVIYYFYKRKKHKNKMMSIGKK